MHKTPLLIYLLQVNLLKTKGKKDSSRNTYETTSKTQKQGPKNAPITDTILNHTALQLNNGSRKNMMKE